MKDETKWRDAALLALWLLAILAVASLILAFIPESDSWWHALLHGIAEALIIAAVIGGTVEIYSKRRFLHEVTSNIFVHIFGHALPVELRARIDEMVRIDLVRSCFHIHYRLSPLSNGRVTLETSYEYVLENLSTRRRKHRPRMSFEKQDNPKVLEFRCDSEDDEKANFCFPGKGVRVGDNPAEANEIEVLGPELDVRPKAKYRLRATNTVDFTENASDVFAFFYPTIGVVVTVDHPDDFTVTVAYIREDATVSPKRYSFAGGFLPGEHIRVRWRKLGETAN